MLLSIADGVLPLFAEAYTVNHSVNTVVTQFWVQLLYERVQLTRAKSAVRTENVHYCIPKDSVHGFAADACPEEYPPHVVLGIVDDRFAVLPQPTVYLTEPPRIGGSRLS